MTIYQTVRSYGIAMAFRAVCVGTLMLLIAPLGAQPVQLDFPAVSPGIPAYARIDLVNHVDTVNTPRNSDWAAIVFYRHPECIPLNFDLGQFFHFPGPDGPGAFGCELLTEGMELWANGPEHGDMAPIFQRARNARPDLPIWFVAWDEFRSLADTGSIFIDQLEALPSLVRGRAWWFEEYINPSEAAADPALSMRANGRLETGGRFALEWHSHGGQDEDEVLIALELGDEAPTQPSGPGSVICHIHPHLPHC
jgi:hypothetical protein